MRYFVELYDEKISVFCGIINLLNTLFGKDQNDLLFGICVISAFDNPFFITEVLCGIFQREIYGERLCIFNYLVSENCIGYEKEIIELLKIIKTGSLRI